MTAGILFSLSSLGPRPVLVLLRTAAPVFTARWISARPARRTAADRVRLAPGVWIVPQTAARSRYRPPEWMDRGLCGALPPEQSDPLFFGIEVREAPGALIAAANQAREICAACPVAVTCLTNALTADERYGVWGGTSGRQREKLRLRLAGGAALDELVAETLPARRRSA